MIRDFTLNEFWYLIQATRWTIVLLRELTAGSTRFNELRRGLPRMSPALLSQRLRELEAAQVLTRRHGDTGAPEYHLTPSGRDLKTLLDAFEAWGQRWMRADERHG